MTDRKKPGVAFWATVVVVAVLIGYPLSFGPASWTCYWAGGGGQIVGFFYGPILSIAMRSKPAAKVVFWYMKLGVPNDAPGPGIGDNEIMWRDRST